MSNSKTTQEIDMNTDQFLQGQRDCRDGVPHQAGKGADYDRGYAAQYEADQIADARSRVTHKRVMA